MELSEKNTTSFFGNVPAPMEMAFLGISLGGPISYESDKITGLDKACVLVPKNGGFEPVMVTLGDPVCMGEDARAAIYHSLGLDSLINSDIASNKTTSEIISTAFAKTFSRMSPNNDYIARFYEPKTAELRDKLLRCYPEQIKFYDAAVESYKQSFAKAFDMKDTGKENEKKNRIMA